MKLRSVLSEAWRNLATGTTRATQFAIATAAIALIGTGADLTAVQGIITSVDSYIEQGGSIQYLVAEDGVDSSNCEALTTYDNVSASGALRNAEELVLDTLPGTTYEAYEVTEGFGDLLGIKSKERGVWISQSLADALGVAVSSSLQSQGRSLDVAGIFTYPNGGRDSRLEHAILVPVPSQGSSFNECWMAAWPQAESADSQLRSALKMVNAESTEVAISQLNRSLSTTLDGSTLYLHRATRWMPLFAIFAGTVLGLIWARARKLEYAAALHAGQTRAALVSTAILECLIWSTLGASLATVVALGLAIGLNPMPEVWMLSLALPSPIAAIAGSLLGALIGASSMREKYLFRYFKER